MIKKIFYILALFSQAAVGQNITGSWSGNLQVMGTELPLVFHIVEKDGRLISTMDSSKQGAKDVPMSETTFTDGILIIKAAALGLIYEAELINEHQLKGTLTQNGMNFGLNLEKGIAEETTLKRPQEPKPPYPYYTEDFTLKNEKEGNLLAGSLYAPNENKDIPIMVMITGSGTQNRDSELLGHKPFLVIADYLARNGIATFRMDDRGAGESEPGKADPTSQDFAGDISSAVNFLAKKGYKKIGLIGHSEGGMIAPIVYKNNKKVKFMVLLAAPGIPIPELMKLQTYRSITSMGLPKIAAHLAAEKNEKLYDFINNHKGEDFDKDLSDLIEKQNPGITPEQLTVAVKQVNNAWFKYFIGFDPQQYLNKVKVPVLAINGDKDVQVTSEENLEGIRESLQKAKNKNFEIVEFPGLNHLFQTAETGSVAEYAEIEETIATEVLEKIVEWIGRVVVRG